MIRDQQLTFHKAHASRHAAAIRLAALLLPILLQNWEGVSYLYFLTEISKFPISFGLIEEVGERKE